MNTTDANTLRQVIEKAWENRELLHEKPTQEAVRRLIRLLDQGELRVAEPDGNGEFANLLYGRQPHNQRR